MCTIWIWAAELGESEEVLPTRTGFEDAGSDTVAWDEILDQDQDHEGWMETPSKGGFGSTG